jgi:CheY-like chemotaxis protein
VDDLSCLDLAALARLERQGGRALVREMVAVFCEDTPARLRVGRWGVESNDLDATRRAAHSLKSSAATIGAVRLHDISARIERLAAQHKGRALTALLPAWESNFDAARRDLTAAVAGGPGAATRKRIAVVEDNRDNRLLLRAIIEDRYELIEYGTGAEALEGMRAAPPDLVLLDISLPAMDGLEVLRHLRADQALAAVPVIAMTAHAMRGDKERFLKAGFDEYVVKPIVDERCFLATIEKALAKAHSQAAGGAR